MAGRGLDFAGVSGGRWRRTERQEARARAGEEDVGARSCEEGGGWGVAEARKSERLLTVEEGKGSRWDHVGLRGEGWGMDPGRGRERWASSQ